MKFKIGAAIRHFTPAEMIRRSPPAKHIHNCIAITNQDAAAASVLTIIAPHQAHNDLEQIFFIAGDTMTNNEKFSSNAKNTADSGPMDRYLTAFQSPPQIIHPLSLSFGAGRK
ncbi:MAG: hypothetical protein ABIT37_07575 [Luteolibacter sp.]